MQCFQDEDREGREHVDVSFDQEIRFYLKESRNYKTKEALKDARPGLRVQHNFKVVTGQKMNFERLQYAANRLESLQYNVPLYITTGGEIPTDVSLSTSSLVPAELTRGFSRLNLFPHFSPWKSRRATRMPSREPGICLNSKISTMTMHAL